MVALRQVSLPVGDLQRAAAFYRDVVGLREIARFEPPGLVFFDLDGVRLLLQGGDAGAASVLYLATDEVVAETDRLRSAGVAIIGEPQLVQRDDDGVFGEPGVEEWMSFFSDSEGNTIGLSERRRALR
jgi:methylmalonyl-CoA/ethylmalonyl-CoA epimerase